MFFNVIYNKFFKINNIGKFFNVKYVIENMFILVILCLNLVIIKVNM